MKRKSSRYRAMPFSTRVAKPINKLNLSSVSFPPANEHSGVRVRKIFVIKQEIHLPQARDADKRMRRILIFDDHPDSLRLVFGPRANPHVHLSALQRVFSWELILASIVTMGALIAMFWAIL